jgi:hypothetical protein
VVVDNGLLVVTVVCTVLSKDTDVVVALLDGTIEVAEGVVIMTLETMDVLVDGHCEVDKSTEPEEEISIVVKDDTFVVSEIANEVVVEGSDLVVDTVVVVVSAIEPVGPTVEVEESV